MVTSCQNFTTAKLASWTWQRAPAHRTAAEGRQIVRGRWCVASSYQFRDNRPASTTSASTATRIAHVVHSSMAKGGRRDVVITASFEFKQKERVVVGFGLFPLVSKRLFYYLTIAYTDSE